MKLFICGLLLVTAALTQSQDLSEIGVAKEEIKSSQSATTEAVETSQHRLGFNVRDTPEVAAAKVAHFEAVRAAEHDTAVANSSVKIAESHQPVMVPVQQNLVSSSQMAQHQLTSNINETPEIAAAKAVHNEAVRLAEQMNSNVHARHISAPIVQYQVGAIVHDTPEVAAAKAAHYEAVREAEHATALANMTVQSGDLKQSEQPATVLYTPSVQHHPTPVIQTTQHQLGVSVQDTPEVAAAKAAHYEALRLAQQVAADSGFNNEGLYVMDPYSQSLHISADHGTGYLSDTPEVAAAKAAHFEALARAELAVGPQFVQQYVPQQALYYQQPYYHTFGQGRMVPIVAVPQTYQHKLGFNVQDTPEVAAAKAAHFEAFRLAQLAAEENPQYPANNYFFNPARQYEQVL